MGMNKLGVLKKTFGYDSFRPGQEELIDGILAGRDVLGIMPTGAGKSLCYQVPALLLPGVSVVVSPLISLMKDQVQALNAAGVHAAFLNSSLTENQIQKAIALAARGRYKIIYVAPERLMTPRFQWLSHEIGISMLCVDEAHCISQWGQDFRPSYLAISDYIASLPERPCVCAFTATATAQVREDIVRALSLRDPLVKITGFDRKNLYWSVEKPKNKTDFCLSYVRKHEGESGIIYCSTRKNVDRLYGILRDERIPAGRYHAGMEQEERVRSQDDFIYDNISVMVATNAFGMGIDKSNVRYVIHYNMPASIENYYQEAGRAGRDGERAECILLYSPQDTLINRMMLENKSGNEQMTPEEARTVHEQDEIRLSRMEHYCVGFSCLRNEILSYFGEPVTEPCGNCGNCSREYTERDCTKEANAALSLISSIPGRYGQNLIAAALHGSKTKRIEETGLDTKPCYGALSSLSEAEIRDLLIQFTDLGILERSEDQYGLFFPGPRAQEVRDGEKVACRFEVQAEESTERPSPRRKKASASSETTVLTPEGNELFAKLRSLRFLLARQRSIPPYLVFSDRTLTQMCITLPRTKEELLALPGVGEKNLASYGNRFLEEIGTYLSDYAKAHDGARPQTTG